MTTENADQNDELRKFYLTQYGEYYNVMRIAYVVFATWATVLTAAWAGILSVGLQSRSLHNPGDADQEFRNKPITDSA